MFGGSLGRMEEHALFIFFVAFILIVFWYAVWELLTEFIDRINKEYGIKKWKIHVISLIGVLVTIYVFPQILKKI
jgi:dolichol kinase